MIEPDRWPALAAGGVWDWGPIAWTYEPFSDRLDPLVSGVRVFAFVEDRCVLVKYCDGDVSPPGGTLEPDEHWVNAALRECREEAGARLLNLHPFGAFRCHQERPYRHHLPHPESVRVVAWADAELSSGPIAVAGGEAVAKVILVPPHEAAVQLHHAGAAEMAELLAMAEELRQGGPDDAIWFEDNLRLLEKHYLAQSDPAAQAGKLGGIKSWNESRRVIAEAIPGDGSFLDVGCANGLLMETVERWCREDGHRVEPYGVDISPGLVELARRRLPRWADRIWLGNAWTWQPPRRFDFVHTRVEYVPVRLRPAFLQRMLGEFVEAGGRLLITPPDYGPPDYLATWGFRVGGEVVRARPGKGAARVAWIDKD